MKVRPACSSDIAAMHRLRLGVRENPLSPASGIGEDSYAAFVDAGAAWVACRGEALIGFAAVEGDTGTVWALFVAPEAEGRGVGSALLRELTAWAARAGLNRLHLSTAAGSRAEGFYRAAGWENVGRTADGELRFELDLLHSR